jgi:putative FmdB family regulatory protein
MPLFEYRCARCEHVFETLVTGDERPLCPRCQGADLEKLLSTFAVQGGGTLPELPPGPCGSCGDPRGPGACSLG